MVGSHEVVGKGIISGENGQMASTVIILCAHKAAKSLAKLINQSCGELRLVVCLSSHLKTTKYSWTSNKPQKQALAKAVWATFSISTCLNC